MKAFLSHLTTHPRLTRTALATSLLYLHLHRAYSHTSYAQHNPKLTLKQWYSHQTAYWDRQAASIDGVLGGYGVVHQRDVEGSRGFLEKLKVASDCKPMGTGRALDCGAGIGRVTKELLLPNFDTIDLIEPSKIQLDQAKLNFHNNTKVATYYQMGLQDFKYEHSYDCIWVQWVLCYLTDEDMVRFLIESKGRLMEGGVIVVKENNSEERPVYDGDDNSVARTREAFERLFERAGLTIVGHEYQRGFPEELMRVSMWALK
ncbi:hypothetical protein FGO68_gene17046 [Halteria grandinella]|uniref:Alpha N-terminal protein methyltransferase 1 n=1 Tax=Halteria grandinella TaxID=5974 RepID=A0A8J8N926_HALGN|nr:hypothetical protein FGO68_gene17046 [Halteria grandinella]